MFRTAGRLGISAVLVGSVVIGLTAGSAGATNATIQMRTFSVSAEGSPPNVNILGKGSSVNFDPTSLTVTDTKNGDCTASHGEWTLWNATSSTQVVASRMFPTFRIKPGEVIGTCSMGSPGTFVVKFSLKSNPDAKLKVTIIIP
jgi:hypothetical protein